MRSPEREHTVGRALKRIRHGIDRIQWQAELPDDLACCVQRAHSPVDEIPHEGGVTGAPPEPREAAELAWPITLPAGCPNELTPAVEVSDAPRVPIGHDNGAVRQPGGSGG